MNTVYRSNLTNKRFLTLVHTVLDVFPNPVGLKVLDVGCGSAELASDLSALGVSYTGVDPNINPESHRTVIRACGSALPFPDQSFDCVVMIKSLHHIPCHKMHRALWEAVRVTCPQGRLLIVEPALKGPSKELLSVVDDETDALTAGRKVILNAVGAGWVRCVDAYRLSVDKNFESFDEYFEKLTKSDPKRSSTAQSLRDDIRSKFIALTRYKSGNFQLRYDFDCWILSRSISFEASVPGYFT